jgi:transposase-like protein
MGSRKFTREFKLEAVRLIKDRGVSYVQAPQDLGVHRSQLRNWGRSSPRIRNTPFRATAR